MKLGKLFSAVVKKATLPLSVGADIITLGGGNGGSFTKRKLEDIEEKLDEVTEDDY